MSRLRNYAPHIYFFFFFSAAASYAPFLAYWLKEAGLTSQQIGLIYAVGPFVALFVQPMWGLLCDKYGMEKAALMVCSLMTPAIAFGYSLGAGFAVYIATAVLLAVFSSPMIPLSDAVAVAHTEKHGQSYGGARVWGSIGYALVVTPIGIVYSHIGLHSMFVMYAAMMTVVFGISFLLGRGSVRKNVSWRDIGALLKNKQISSFLLLILLVACGTQSYSIFFSVYLGTTGGNVSEKIGWMTAVAALSELPFFIYSLRLVERFGYKVLLAAGAFTAAFRLGLLSLDPPFAVLLASQLLQGLTYAMFYAAGVQYANKLCPEGWKTTGQTLFSMVYINLSILITSNFGGWLIDNAGFSALFRTASVLCLTGAIGFAALHRLSRESRAV